MMKVFADESMVSNGQKKAKMTLRAFFLGAGFSKAINPLYPTLAELSAIVDQNLRERHQSGAIRAHLEQIPPQLRGDIEQLLSYLYSDWPWKSSGDKHLDQALYEAFVYEIWKSLSSIPLLEISEDQKQFIQFLRVTEANSVISVNYDNLVEEYRSSLRNAVDMDYLLGGLSIRVEERFETIRKTSEKNPFVTEYTSNLERPTRYIFAREWLSQVNVEEFCSVFIEASKDHPKRHLWNTSTHIRYVFELLTKHEAPYPTKPFDLLPHHGKVLHLHGSFHERSTSTNPTIRVADKDGISRLESLPAIVPPVMDKSRHYAANELKIVWNAAHQAIRQAQELVIIGFSFPPTDISCQFLFKSAIQQGTRVVVVNRDPMVKARYDTVLAGVSNVDLDYSFVGGTDPMDRYIRKEVLRQPSTGDL